MSKASRHIIIPEVEPFKLPTGTISMSQVNTELRRPATQSINLNDPTVRKLAGRASGAISMNDLRGKSASAAILRVEKFKPTHSQNWIRAYADPDSKLLGSGIRNKGSLIPKVVETNRGTMTLYALYMADSPYGASQADSYSETDKQYTGKLRITYNGGEFIQDMVPYRSQGGRYAFQTTPVSNYFNGKENTDIVISKFEWI